MADSHCNLAGLCDRLRAIVSLYKTCKEKQLNFRINFTDPFVLSDYLVPNSYNWTINPGDISYNLNYVRPVYFTHLFGALSKYTVLKNVNRKCQQIQFYTNARFGDDEYSVLIKELFEPSEILRKEIKCHLEKIGEEFITVGFRFRNLLGDPLVKKNKLKILSEDDKEFLISKCIKQLMNIYLENDKKIFVISDSVIFLKRMNELTNVYYIPGMINDISQVDILDDDTIKKIFLDYYIAGNSKKVITVVNKDMYRSGFHYYAALHNNVPYEIMDI
jgi:hypothetical protein